MKKNLSIALLSVIFLVPLFIFAQTGNKAGSTNITQYLRVTSPIPNGDALLDGFTYDKDGHFKFTITFNRPVDISTVIIRNTLQLSFSKDANANANLSWSNNNMTLTIITEKTSNQLLTFSPDAGFKITLKGTRRDASRIGVVRIVPGGVKATNGHFLDGDNNHKDGGDYTVYFRIVG